MPPQVFANEPNVNYPFEYVNSKAILIGVIITYIVYAVVKKKFVLIDSYVYN